MQKVKNTLSFGATDTNKSGELYDNGMIRSIVMKVPNFTNAVTVTRIDIYDDEGDAIYANTTGWAKNATHLVTSLAIPCGINFSIKITLSGAPGGTGGDVVAKSYVEQI